MNHVFVQFSNSIYFTFQVLELPSIVPLRNEPPPPLCKKKSNPHDLLGYIYIPEDPHSRGSRYIVCFDFLFPPPLGACTSLTGIVKENTHGVLDEKLNNRKKPPPPHYHGKIGVKRRLSLAIQNKAANVF